MTTKQWEAMVNRVTTPRGNSPVPDKASFSTLSAGLERLAALPTAYQGKATTPMGGLSAGSLLSGPQGLVSSVVSSVLPGSSGSTGHGLLSTLAGGLGLGSLISGLVSLFGGGGHEEPPPLVKFQLPAAVSREESLGRPGAAPVDISYGQNGLPRANGPTSSTPQSITVQVQAMDSKSFLDHSEDIARAVREAMLYSHSINDVVTEL